MKRNEAGFTFLEFTIVVVVLGVGAAIAIPKFMEYMKAPQDDEATVQLEKLQTATTRFYLANSRFPIGTSAVLPPKGCCGNPNNKCPVITPATWAADPVWSALDFAITEANFFQYAFVSDALGQTFTATATGDLDCDGNKITYKLAGSVVDGVPRAALQKPARHED